jgi:hypothetical protein
MTCLYLHKKGYLVAHIGDSRIYHIRPNTGILYQSSDHSLVNDLLRAGELTEEQAINFPQKNVITRAMQPNLERRHKADIYSFDNVQKGDYFFLCSDGVLEQLTNETLCQILADDNLSDEQKKDAIKEVCDGKTKDNNTCFLIPVDDVIVEAGDDSTGGNDDVIIGVESDVEHASEKEPIPTGKDDAKSTCKWDLSKCNKWVLMVVVLLIFVGSIAAFWPLFHKDKEKPSVKTEQVKKSSDKKIPKKTKRLYPSPPKSSVKTMAPQKDSSKTKSTLISTTKRRG